MLDTCLDTCIFFHPAITSSPGYQQNNPDKVTYRLTLAQTDALLASVVDTVKALAQSNRQLLTWLSRGRPWLQHPPAATLDDGVTECLMQCVEGACLLGAMFE